MSSSIPRLLLSYSSKDADEVEDLDLEMRRRGVPLWRDRSNLKNGRHQEDEIEKAARAAAGFIFYLTENAAKNDWVRETERTYALQNAKRDGSFGILPIFREPRKEVVEEMKRLGQEPPRPGEPSPYDLSGYAGFIFDPREVAAGRKDGQIRAAAEASLGLMLDTLRLRRDPGAKLRIGAATRGGPALSDKEMDLLLDWSYDYPPHQAAPSHAVAERMLSPALASLADSIRQNWHRRSLQIIPQCHLSMALALGFQFRRNTGYDLEVMDVYSGDCWAGPAKPLPEDPSFWSTDKSKDCGSGKDLVVGIAISQPIDVKLLEDFAKSSGLGVGHILLFEPKACAPSKECLQPKSPEEVHRTAVAVTEAITRKRSEGFRGTVHLVGTLPAGFAVLLGQQLSNVGLVQSYEWSDGEGRYLPSFRFASS
jgi:hypothetical protein